MLKLSKQAKILHVDDDIDFLSLFSLMFRKTFDIFSAENAKKAFEILENNDIDLIITDYDMPEMNGLELLHSIRKKNYEIPVIFKTGQGNEEVAREAFIHGASDYFTKDISTFAFKEKFINSIKTAIEKKRNEEEKRKAEEELRKFKTISDQAVHGNAIADTQGNLLYINDYFAKIHGYTSNELLGKNLSIFHNEEQMEAVITLNKMLVKEGSYNPTEVWHTHKNGTVFPMLMSGIVIKNERGEPQYLAATAVDITGLKEAEAQLRLQSLVLEQIQDRVTITDLNGIITYVNKAEVKSLGYSKEELIGNSVKKYGDNPDRGAKQDDLISKTISEGHWRGEIANQTAEGEEIILDCRTQAVHDETGKVVALCGISTDITERKEKEERIRHLNTVLSAIRDINKLITREKNPNQLINTACKILVENRGFYSAWVVLLDESGNMIKTGNSGFGEDFNLFLEELKKDKTPACIQAALESHEPLLLINSENKCKDCMLMQRYDDKGIMTAKLQHKDKLFGLMTVSVPLNYVKDPEEQVLFHQIVEDMAFALHSIELEEKQKRVEEALIQNEKDLREAQRLAKLGNWKWDVRTGEVEWSDEVYRIFELDPDKFTPQIDSIQALSPWPEEHNRDKELIEIAINSREKGSYEQKFLFPNGDIGHYKSTFQGRYNDDGELISIFGTVLDITEQKRSKEKLRQSEEKYRSLFNNLNVAVALHEVILDENNKPVDFIFLDVNPAYEKLIGVKAKDVIGKKGSLVIPDMEKEWFEVPASVAITGEPITLTGYAKRMDKYILLKSYSPRKNQYAVTIIDITESFRSEEMLKAEQAFTNSIIQSLPGLFYMFDKESNKFVRRNENWTTVTGYTDEELDKMTIQSFLSNKELGLMKIQEVYETGNASMENILVTKDGKKTPYYFTGKKLEIDNEVYIVGLAIDISERKKAEEALRQRNKEIALIHDFAVSVISSLDLDKVLITILEEICSLLKTHSSSVWLLDHTTGELICRQSTGSRKEMLNGWSLPPGKGIAGWVAQNGNSLMIPDVQKDKRYYRKIEEQLKFDIHSLICVPLKVKNNIIGVLEVVDTQYDRFRESDLTLLEAITTTAAIAIENANLYKKSQQELQLRKQVEEMLTNKNRELNDFAYIVSHDLKAPINNIRGYLNAIKEEPEIFDQYFHHVIKQADSLDAFINQLLNLSRIGKVIDNKTSIDLEAMLWHIYNTKQESRNSTKLIFHTQPPRILGDSMRIEQVFNNLIDNSIKYRDPNKEKLLLEIKHKITGNKVILYFKDNGLGVSGEYIEKLFDPGFVLNRKKGTGFGLAIVKKIIEGHGGRVCALSEGKYKGLTIKMELPYVEKKQN